MGFFDKVVRSVTGSWADISVVTQPMTPGLTREFTTRITVKDKPIEFRKIVADIHCTERASVTVSSRHNDGMGRDTETDSAIVHELAIELRGPGKFSADHYEEITFPVSIPREGPFSFSGRHVELEWEVEVSIDMSGNDPDSGWETFKVGSPG